MPITLIATIAALWHRFPTGAYMMDGSARYGKKKHCLKQWHTGKVSNFGCSKRKG